MDVGFAGFPLQPSVQEVAAIELDSGLGCVNLHYSPRRRFVNPGSQREFAVFASLVQHPIVIKPKPELKLLVLLTDVATDGFR